MILLLNQSEWLRHLGEFFPFSVSQSPCGGGRSCLSIYYLPSFLAISALISMTQISPYLHNHLPSQLRWPLFLLCFGHLHSYDLDSTITENCSRVLSALLWVYCSCLPTFSFSSSNQIYSWSLFKTSSQSIPLNFPCLLKPHLVSANSTQTFQCCFLQHPTHVSLQFSHYFSFINLFQQMFIFIY